MFRIFKILIFFIALVFSNNVNAKPVPPGAGDGDVPANILFLVDSSASMGRWIGTDGLGRATGVSYDSQGRILISQNIRRSIGSVIRYTADGERDTTFRPIRRIPNMGCSQETDRNRAIGGRNFRAASTVKFVEGLSSTVINNENIIFANSRERRFNNFIFGFSENGTTCRFALGTPGGSVIHDFDIKIINGTPHMFVIGRGWRARSSFFKSCDLSTMQCNTQTLDRNHIARFSNRMSVNNEGTIVYISDNRTGDLVGHTLTPMGSTYEIGAETRRCTSVNDPELTSQVMSATAVEVSPDNSNIVYITSHLSHALQKLQLTDTDCTVVTSIGLGAASNARNSGDPNTIAAGDVNFNTPWGFHVTSTRVLVATHRGFVDEFDEDLFTVAGRDTAWLQQMGGPRVRRWDGVKEALNAILNDTTLTTGAHFGFGHWNAGENQGRRGPRGGQYCHRHADCNYYGGWGGFTSANIGQTQTTETQNADGTITTTTTNLQTDTGSQLASNAHPNGTSTLCHVDACINVAVSSSGAGKIMDVFNPLGMAWGTDSHAFSQMAEEYFNDTNAGEQILDPDSDCQLNYIIVIGDGAMTNTGVLGAGGQTAARMQRLREKGVKSLYVAYGGGITGDNLRRFHELARIGSSTLTAATAQECIDHDECERAIVALTPEDLKTALTAKIRQIIADRLAFTAPSITATIEEGGSLYQAQFSYEQFGEWQGTILRKGIDAKGEVTHLITDPGNWSAAAQIKGQSTRGSTADTRYIWSAIPGVPYGDGIPDNFNTDNSTAIRGLFETLGYSIQDYHNASSDCEDIGNNSILGDEVNGLLLFMKGNDYFDYNGDCDVEEVRNHVMGDIYHSQLIEIGAPDMNIVFSDRNEEAYHRVKNGYQGFMTRESNRKNVLYAGSNSGMLHAIDALTGKEIWGFVPPFVAALLPQIVNKDYDGAVGSDNTGGTNPIFGVDGSPVVHDLFIQGYTMNGGVAQLDAEKSWRTILFIPYGRGGPGFSVLDVTDPEGPIHMFSLYNDRIKSRVLISDVDGQISEYEYNRSSSSLLDTSEGQQAIDNTNDARDEDDKRTDDLTPNQDAIAACQTTSDFKTNGTNSCYQGRVFHFPTIGLDYDIDEDIPDGLIGAFRNENGQSIPLLIDSAKMVDDGAGGGLLQITFSATNGNLTFNGNPSDANSALTDNVTVTACLGASGIDPQYDYSKLGETWSTPKIVRMPSSSDGDLDSDRYVAILGAGMSKGDKCGGSALFLVDLEGHVDGLPGRIHGSEINGGPITIVDTSPFGLNFGDEVIATPNGSDIQNAVPASPVVITPDTAPNIEWRGALVYVNDLEGKITKINLTNSTEGYAANSDSFTDGVTELYDQTTLFRLDATEANGRFSFFSMDAGIGVSDGGFWLFGSTGNFTDLGNRSNSIDNILYGVQDPHYPYFKHLNGVTIPKAVDASNSTTTITSTNTSAEIEIDPKFIKLAHEGANDTSNNVANATKCINVSGDKTGSNCPLPDNSLAWVIHLEKDSAGNFLNVRTHRKASATPTLFKGKVYFPVYQPPPGSAKCNQGHAFICAADDECGTNSSDQLKLVTPGDVNNPSANACAYVREGVLSELVVFSDKLYANVAGPADDEDTLFSILSIPGDIITNKGGWRDSSF